MHLTRIKSPLRYPEGKSRAVELIVSLLPEFDEFREPFLGGGSVFLCAKQKYQQCRFWGNDLYPELYKFWEQAQKKDITSLLAKIYEWRKRFIVGKKLKNSDAEALAVLRYSAACIG